MRISDWSSDVCSSDLEWPHETTPTPAEVRELAEGIAAAIAAQPSVPEPLLREERDKGFSAGWDYGYKHGSKQGFSLGVCVSLAVVRSHDARSEEHTSELQSLMRISYAVFCLKKKNTRKSNNNE